MIKSMGELLKRRAHLTPDREAFIFPDAGKRVSFSELNLRSNRVAHALLSLGLGRGDRIGILAMNCVEYLEMHFASAKIGTIMVPLNWRLVPLELAYIVNNSGMDLLVFGTELFESAQALSEMDTGINKWMELGGKLQMKSASNYETLVQAQSEDNPEVFPEPSGDDDLFIMYTSGTTGKPKGAVHTHASGFNGTLTMDAAIQFDADDRYITAMPMFHAGGYGPLTVNIFRGVPTIVLQNFDPERVWELIEQESASCGMMVPAMIQFMERVPDFEKRFDFSSMRWIHCGGAPVPTALAKKFDERGIALLQGYGSTETGGMICLGEKETCVSRSDSTGKAVLHVQIKIVDDAGNKCAPGETGEVIVSGGCIMRGYWNNIDATADSIIDGWLHMGDIASMDQDGFVTIRDRKKDMIISGGENIYPAEVENCLLSHPKVAEVGVIAQPSERWGESPFAVIVGSDDSLTEQELINHCENNLASFKRPCGFGFLDALPRNAGGKILKRVLRDQFPGPAPA